MKELNDLVELAERADSLCLLMQNVNPHYILAIDDAFKALERRADDADRQRGDYVSCDTFEAMQQRAEAAETKLAELVPNIGSSQVNDAAWVLHDRLGEYGPLTSGQFNNIKGCFYDALKVCMGVKP